LASDPVTRALEDLGNLGEVTDIGCGPGHLALFLLETGQAKSVHGFDPDEARIALARQAGVGLPAVFEVGDARTHEIAPCDTVLLVDMLHYVSPEEQNRVILRAAEAARKMVVVRDIRPGRGLSSFFTRSAERLRVRPNVQSTAVLRSLLEREGLEVSVTECDEGTPFANAMLVARRRSP
jgi:SAM-dependent methyltransferase